MTHFTKDEFIDALDGELPNAGSAHLAACAACRDELAHLRRAFARTKDVEIPEPSPLFWEHFSANVRQAIREPAPRSISLGWLRRPAGVWTVAAALTTIVLAVVVTQRIPLSSALGPKAAIEPPAASHADGARHQPALVEDIDTDEGWSLVRSVADEIPWDQTHAAGLSTTPDSVAQMAAEMSPRERRELALLVEDELRRKGA